MDAIGDYFKQVREAKGLTLDDVASKTRIAPEFLQALEEGNFAKLPDQVFAKGFVRSYARTLALDEQEAMRCFHESAGAFYNKQLELDRLRQQQVEDERQRLTNRKVVAAGVGVALLGLVLLLNREQSSVTVRPHASDAEPATMAATATGSVASGAGQVGTSRSSGEVERPRQNAVLRGDASAGGTVESPGADIERSAFSSGQALHPEAVPPLMAVPSEPLDGLPADRNEPRNPMLVLEVEAMELSWVVVQTDGTGPYEALLRSGERAQWKAVDRFTVTLGNAGGVRVLLNGKEQGPFGPKGKVVREIVLRREH
jgi:transcriptional regulator with XRE-family HTH domain